MKIEFQFEPSIGSEKASAALVTPGSARSRDWQVVEERRRRLSLRPLLAGEHEARRQQVIRPGSRSRPASARCSVRIISPAPVEQHQRQRGLDDHQPAAQPVRARRRIRRRVRGPARAGRRRRTPGTPGTRRRRCRRSRRRRARTAAPRPSRRTSASRGVPSGATATSARSSHDRDARRRARRRPTETSVLSTSSWLASRMRPPPSAARTASSCCRDAPRAISRFATLTHAMSSRKPTAPNSTSSVRRTSATRRSASGSAVTLTPAVGVRVLALERGGDRLQLAVGRFDRDARLQPAERVEALWLPRSSSRRRRRRSGPST